MDDQLHLHVHGVPATGGGETRLVSPDLPPPTVAALEASLYYGSPEDPAVSPPFAWSVIPLDAETAVLTRAWRPASELERAGTLIAHSVTFPRAADVLATGQVLDLADDLDLFPDPPLRAPQEPLARPLPPAHNRLTEVFGSLLRAVRGDRTVLGEDGGPLRAVVFALPSSMFREDLENLRTILGLLAAVPRRQRTALSFASYQDSPSPRPLKVLAVPEDHRCVPRLVRSNGYVVFPHPAPQVKLLHPRILEYGGLTADLLLSGRFEEVQALSATFDLHGSAPADHAQRAVEGHADLLRLAKTASVSGVVTWLDNNPLPEDAEKRRILVDAVARTLDAEAKHGRHGAGAQLLRTLGVRWTDPDWVSGLSDHLRAPFAAFVVSWYETGGWAPIVALFGRLTSGDVWIRELFTEAVAEAVAERIEKPGPDDETMLATLEAQFDALERAVPPVRYLRWRIRYVGDEDGRVRAWLLRFLRHPRALETILSLLRSFDSPHHPVLGQLLQTILAPLAATPPDVVRELVGDLVEHFGRTKGGLVLLGRALASLAAAGAEGLVVDLTVAHLLPLAGLDARHDALHRRLLTVVANAVPGERWRTATNAAIAAASPDRRDRLRNLRRLWVALLDAPGGHGSRTIADVLGTIHASVPEIAADPEPHGAIARVGGPEASAALAIDDLLLLSARAADEDVRRFLGGLFAILDRVFPTERWHWQFALVRAARNPMRPVGDRATSLWWFWSAGRDAGFPDLARHAARTLLLDNLLSSLGESRFELLCRLLPSETGFTREQLLFAAVEGALLRWTEPTGEARGTAAAGATIPVALFRHFTPQADSLSREAYGRVVRRFVETCLVLRDGTTDDMRTLIDRVYVPRHWEVLAAAIRESVDRSPRLRGHLAALRRTTLGRRLPPQLLGALDDSLSSGRGPVLE